MVQTLLKPLQNTFKLTKSEDITKEDKGHYENRSKQIASGGLVAEHPDPNGCSDPPLNGGRGGERDNPGVMRQKSVNLSIFDEDDKKVGGRVCPPSLFFFVFFCCTGCKHGM